jgi:hypothetical protein
MPRIPHRDTSTEATLHIDISLLGPLSALCGALLGGGASLVGAIYTQHYQDRLQRIANEAAKREAVYADFIMIASNLVLTAFVYDDIELRGDEQRLIGLINRMRLFAPSDVVAEAEGVFKTILEISLKPKIELRQLAKEAVAKGLDPDPLLAFSQVCRADLDRVPLCSGARPRQARLFGTRRRKLGRLSLPSGADGRPRSPV